MLNRRTDILFDKDLWNNLTRLAKSANVSVGEFVRMMLKERIVEEKEREKRKRAIDATLMGRLMSKGKIDYKELINYGRKY